MARNFLSINSNYNDFSSLKSPEINKYVLENNSIILSKVYGFCQKPEDVLFITGFFGTGKAQIVNHLLSYLHKDVYSFKVDCSAATTLDDILLFLWAQFISVASNSEIAYRYRQSSSFQERISGCFTESSANIVITLFDFDLVEEHNAQSILDFIWTIAKDDKTKVIITAKTFDTTIVPDEVLYTKVILKALSRLIFEKYLQDKGLRATPRIFDELYKITRGYYFYTEITSRILNKKELSINDYLVAYTNSGMSFDKFLAKAYISMLPVECKSILARLSVIRHPVNTQMLDYMEVFDKYSMDYLSNDKFIKPVEDLYILNNYFKNAMLLEIDDDTKISIHKELIKFYNSQLPLKPSDRLIMLSRTSMRAEIEFHKEVIAPKVSAPVPEKVIPQSETLIAMSSSELLETGNNLFNEYKYQDALKTYLEILERDEIDKNDIYLKLAELYSRLGNLKYSIFYYNLLIKHYSELNNQEEVNEFKINVAQIYYQSYKTNDAINILYEIISESTNTKTTIEAYTILGNIYISLAAKNKAYELYNKAIALAERESGLDNSSELYFKFAILADENDEVDTAVRYYKKCIEVSPDNNKYKSLSYSNLGDFYLDLDDKKLALENFKSAHILDEKNSNDYGMYYSASNIAKLIVSSYPDEAAEYLIKAKTSAIKTNDIFAMANAGLHLGDYYSNKNKPEDALKEYFSVLNLVKDKFSQENMKKITVRIEDIKRKIGEDKFNELCGN